MTLTERLQAQLAARAATDPRMRAILRRIQAGTASFSDTALYTRYLGEQLGGILADALPDAAPEEIAEAARVLLREAHADVTAQAAIVQEIQDRQLGASLAAKRPKYPARRVEKVASALTDQTVPAETRQRRARNASANVVASYHDTFIKENARIRSDAGFSCKTVRLGTQCCPWCAELTGSYPAGSEPRDLFRRHDNCGCTVTYEEGRQRQDVWTKRSWERVDPEEVAAGAPEPTVFSREDAAAMEESLLSGLTLAGERDIMMIEAESPYKHPKTPLKIDSHMQGKHIRGEKRYNDYMQHHTIEPSYLTINMEKAQELVDKFHGSGILKLNKNGEILDSEIIIDNDEVVGVAVNNITGASQSTTAFKIKYGPNGTHIVPTYESQKKYFIERRRQDGHDWLLRQKS